MFKNMRKLSLLLLAGAAAASGQSLSVGAIGGAGFNDVVNAASVGSLQSVANSNNFTIGPAVRVNLPLSLRIEVDALYRPYKFSFTGGGGVAYPVSAQQWRFPVLLQYRFNAVPLVHPFVEAGLSFDHLASIKDAASSVITSGPGTLLHPSDASFVLGGGVDVKIPLVRLSGELRYTRQTVSNFASISNLNQAEVLFGIHF
jgi:hypothetical protein